MVKKWAWTRMIGWILVYSSWQADQGPTMTSSILVSPILNRLLVWSRELTGTEWRTDHVGQNRCKCSIKWLNEPRWCWIEAALTAGTPSDQSTDFLGGNISESRKSMSGWMTANRELWASSWVSDALHFIMEELSKLIRTEFCFNVRRSQQTSVSSKFLAVVMLLLQCTCSNTSSPSSVLDSGIPPWLADTRLVM